MVLAFLDMDLMEMNCHWYQNLRDGPSVPTLASIFTFNRFLVHSHHDDDPGLGYQGLEHTTCPLMIQP